MPCGCNKNKAVEWVYTDVKGKAHPQPSELQAKVAFIRAGKKGTITSRTKKG